MKLYVTASNDKLVEMESTSTYKLLLVSLIDTSYD